MKTLSFSFLVAVALLSTACMSGYQTLMPADRLSTIPTPVHGQEVEVFFPGERPKDTAYVKIAVLEHKVEGEVAYAQLVEQLKQKAQLQGMDALLLLGKNQSTKLKSDQGLLETLVEITSGEEIRDNYYSVTTHELSGVGIKYKRNLQYLPEYVQTKQVYALENGAEKPLATVLVDYQGSDKKITTANQTDENTYRNNVQRYNLHHLLKEEGPNWRYSTYGGLVQKRKLISDKGAGVLKTVKIKYNAAQLPVKLELYNANLPLTEVITIGYNEQNQVVEKQVFRNKQLYLKETNTYDTAGKLVSTLHELIHEGKSIPAFKTVYNYYSLLSLN
ncbi:hypothetical protein [Sabulibacter ruber]|uniref:hypothetical protein n=1 Tax=Sabulibacter ruber TaxID=2811901 RepID=UPI001A95EFFF|nr:hypothetical protein [Sabulibacter ruber]